MRITAAQLRRIIKEEVESINEVSPLGPPQDRPKRAQFAGNWKRIYNSGIYQIVASSGSPTKYNWLNKVTGEEKIGEDAGQALDQITKDYQEMMEDQLNDIEALVLDADRKE